MSTFLVYEPRRAIREVLVQRLVGIAPGDPSRRRRDAAGRPAGSSPPRSSVEWVDDPEQFVTAYARRPAQVVLVGVVRGENIAVELTRWLLGVFPEAVVVMLGAAGDREAAASAVAVGAHGFLCLEDLCAPSPARPRALLGAATLAARSAALDIPALDGPVLDGSGSTAVGEGSGSAVVDAAARGRGTATSEVCAAAHGARTADGGERAGQPRREGRVRTGQGRQGAELSRREHQILVGISQGLTNGAIGAELYVSEDTVKTHARRLYAKLGVNDRGSAVAAGFRRELLV